MNISRITILSENPSGLAQFYTAVFGVRLVTDDYSLYTGYSSGTEIIIGQVDEKHNNSVSLTVTVDNLEETLRKCLDYGGQQLSTIVEAARRERFCWISDVDANSIHIVQYTD